MVCAATSKAISGSRAMPVAHSDTAAPRCGIQQAHFSDEFGSRRSVATSPLADQNAIASSWPPASRSTLSMWEPKARLSAESAIATRPSRIARFGNLSPLFDGLSKAQAVSYLWTQRILRLQRHCTNYVGRLAQNRRGSSSLFL